tara:strand:- start:538 stop:795 length:258 start_codon:yes stop_codon:yes gene_type:complete
MKDKDRIKQLEEQLAQKYTYVHEIHTFQCCDGELYLGYGEQEQSLVINVDTLYKDLPSIISMVCKENTKQQEMYADMIKESIKQL